MRLMKLKHLGVSLQTRTHARNLKLSANQVRCLCNGVIDLSCEASDILPIPQREILGRAFRGTSPQINANPHFLWRTGSRTINPLYDYLFDAYIFGEQWKQCLSSPLPSLEEQIKRWKPLHFPLEDRRHRFGLTPFGTYLEFKQEMEFCIPYYASEVSRGACLSYEDLRLKKDKECREEVLQFLKAIEFPFQVDLTPAVLRQLWILIYSFEKLFLEI